jgi:hypothetical protein
MVAAVLVSRPQKVCTQCRASSICTVISLKVVSMRLRHSAMTFRRMEGMAARCPLSGGTRTAVPRAAWAAAKHGGGPQTRLEDLVDLLVEEVVAAVDAMAVDASRAPPPCRSTRTCGTGSA